MNTKPRTLRIVRYGLIVVTLLLWLLPGELHAQIDPTISRHTMITQIQDKWEQLGGETGFLGYPVTDSIRQDDGGYYNEFQNGMIWWHPDSGAFELHGEIWHAFSQFSSGKMEEYAINFTGYPLTDVTPTPDGQGQYVHFTKISIYYHPNTGAYEVHGAIRDKWASLGWEQGFLGYPITHQTMTSDRVGQYNHFQWGSIYWHPNIGAYEVHGAIHDKWASLGWEKSTLGYPVSDETSTPDGIGRYNNFEHGSIYWHPDPTIGTHTVITPILDKWKQLGGESGFLGYPRTDSIRMDDGGYYNEFQDGMMIWWHPDHGAFELHGEILRKFGQLTVSMDGYDVSFTGYPLTDVTPTPDGQGQFVHFTKISIYYHPNTGTHVVRGQIKDKWARLGYERSSYGYPVSEEKQDDDGVIQQFQGGTLSWYPLVKPQILSFTANPDHVNAGEMSTLNWTVKCRFGCKVDLVETLHGKVLASDLPLNGSYAVKPDAPSSGYRLTAQNEVGKASKEVGVFVPMSSESQLPIGMRRTTCGDYDQPNDNATLTGRITKIFNPNQFTLKISHPSGGIVNISPGSTVSVSWSSSNLANLWDAYITDNIRCEDTPVGLSFIISYNQSVFLPFINR